METEPEKHHILIVNIITGDNNTSTIILNSKLKHFNNTNKIEEPMYQDLTQIVKTLQEENSQLRQALVNKDKSLMDKDSIISLLLLRQGKK